jgi:hypothetical protein
LIFDIGVFILGCVGAAAPEIVRVYRTKSSNFNISLRNAFVSIIFFLLGGTVAIVLQSPNLYSAFYSGIATPIIVSKIGEQSPTLPPKEPIAPAPSSISLSPLESQEKESAEGEKIRIEESEGAEVEATKPPKAGKRIHREERARALNLIMMPKKTKLSFREYLWMLNNSSETKKN